MKGQDLKDKFLKKSAQGKVGVIAIGRDFWYHVHNDEEIPERNELDGEPYTIALHPRPRAWRDPQSIL